MLKVGYLYASLGSSLDVSRVKVRGKLWVRARAVHCTHYELTQVEEMKGDIRFIRRIDPHRHDTLSSDSRMMRSRRQFLSDIATFLEIDWDRIS